MFVDYFSLFPPCSDFIIKDDSCLSTVGNDGSQYSGGENTILCETGDAYVTESSYGSILDSGSYDNKSVTWSDFVVSVDNDGSIEYERMSLQCGTAEGLVGVSKSKIPVELENRQTLQPSD